MKKPSKPNIPIEPVEPDEYYRSQKINCGSLYKETTIKEIIAQCKHYLSNNQAVKLTAEEVDIDNICIDVESDYYDGYTVEVYYITDYKKYPDAYQDELKRYEKNKKSYEIKKSEFDKKIKKYNKELAEYNKFKQEAEQLQKKKLYEKLKQEFEHAENTKN